MTGKADKATLTAVIPKRLNQLIRADARKFHKTIDGVAEAIVEQFYLTRNSAEREAVFARLPNKRTGRPL